MKRKLLFLSAAIAAISFGASADVTYELICKGTRIDDTASKYATDGKKLGQGVTMTYDATQGCYVCKVKEIDVDEQGFKIISDSQDVVNQVKTAGLSTASLWHTQWGCSHEGGILDYTAEGAPTTIIDFYTSVSDKGFTPGDMCFTGGVAKLKDAEVQFWPEDKMLKITGTPSKYRSYYQLFECTVDANGITSGNTWKSNLNMDENNPGVYSVEYDFGSEEGIKYFDIRSTKSMPVYGFSRYTDEPAIEEEAVTRAESNVLTRQLTAYSNHQLDNRSSFSATAVKTRVPRPMKLNLTGKYNVTMNTNTGEVSFAAVSGDTQTSVGEIVSDENAPVEYFNMQGVRVANPENGIYVRRQGNKVSKVIVK